MTARVIIGILALIFGFGFGVLAWFTWGFNNHAIGFPYKEFAVAAAALIGLSVWMVFL